MLCLINKILFIKDKATSLTPNIYPSKLLAFSPPSIPGYRRAMEIKTYFPQTWHVWLTQQSSWGVRVSFLVALTTKQTETRASSRCRPAAQRDKYWKYADFFRSSTLLATHSLTHVFLLCFFGQWEKWQSCALKESFYFYSALWNGC